MVGGVLGVTTHLLSGSIPVVRGPFLLHPGWFNQAFQVPRMEVLTYVSCM